MAKAKAIVKRRKAVTNIRKITRTMQLIATARFQRAFNRAMATKPYTESITELVRQVAARCDRGAHRLLQPNESAGRSALLVITSNRGLCGGYNASLLRTATAHLRSRPDQEQVDLYVAGKKGINYFRFLGRPLAATFTQFEDRPQLAQVEPIADSMIRQYSEGLLRTAHVVYMQFLSTATQKPEVMQLLPLQAPEPEALPGAARLAAPAPVEYEYSPPPEELLAELLPLAVKTRLFQAFTDAAVSEQVARMVAMKAATDAANDMIKTLTRAYNRARQTQITLELLDIVAGAEALK